MSISPFGDLSAALHGKDRCTEIWKLVAFLGRYGHQQAKDILAMPVTQTMRLAEQVGELIAEENDAHRRAMETDG